ncbi:AI-2E family transporter [Eubacterium xylanophilum]|uniref:AI-2E family transporter n=1 Tax=Eubacterium xylanophilum TaxID=39497 RepID=UPI00047BDEF4|nr:AI-2E family transporter [Eubacterium xylanophilum]
MKRKIDSKYIQIGIVAFFVMIAVSLFSILVLNIGALGDFVDKITTALMPIIIGFCIAYLLNPLVKRLERAVIIPLLYKVTRKREFINKVARVIAVFIVLIGAIAVIVWLLILVVPEVLDSIIKLAKNLPTYYKNVVGFVHDIKDKHPMIAGYTKEIADSSYTQFRTWLQEKIVPTSTDVLSFISAGIFDAIGVLGNVFIGLIISIYMMIDREKFLGQAKRLAFAVFEKKKVRFLFELMQDIDYTFIKFFGGKVIDSLIVGIVTFISLSIADIPYTSLVSVLIGVTNMIPMFGQFIGIIPSAVLIVIVDPVKGIIFLVIVIIIMQVDGNIIGPKIIGESIGISSFWILFAIVIGGYTFGIPGMVCGVPLFAVAYKLMRRWSRKKLLQKGLPDDTEKYRRKQL